VNTSYNPPCVSRIYSFILTNQEHAQWLVGLSPGGGRGGKKGAGSILDKPAVQIAAPKVAKPKAKEEVKVSLKFEEVTTVVAKGCYTRAASKW